MDRLFWARLLIHAGWAAAVALLVTVWAVIIVALLAIGRLLLRQILPVFS